MSRYIDADALITDLNKGLWGKDWDKVLAEAIINDAPSIDLADYVPREFHDKTCEDMARRHQAEIAELTADRPQGEWIEHEHGFWTFVNDRGERDGWLPDYECNLCGSRAWRYATNFCPNCGADMRKESE